MSYPARPSPVNSLSNSTSLECKPWEKIEMSYPARPSVNSSSNSSSLECKPWEKIEENGCKGPDHELVEQAMLRGATPRGFGSGALVVAKRPRMMEEEEMVEASMVVESLPAEDCEAYGRSVAAQLRQMGHMQKCLAQRLISEVCFRGQMQILHMSTTLESQSAPAVRQPISQHFYPSRGTPNPGFGRDILMQAARPVQQQQSYSPSLVQQQPYSPNFVQQQPTEPSSAANNLNHGEM